MIKIWSAKQFTISDKIDSRFQMIHRSFSFKRTSIQHRRNMKIGFQDFDVIVVNRIFTNLCTPINPTTDYPDFQFLKRSRSEVNVEVGSGFDTEIEKERGKTTIAGFFYRKKKSKNSFFCFRKEVSLMSFDNIFLIDGFLTFFEGYATSNSKRSRILFSAVT